jgi:DMSO/TMAO reductase YedYZ molybdopterin-dependent catalytic subunit
MDSRAMSRRDVLLTGGAAVAGLAFLRFPWPAHAFPSQPGEQVVPWADQPPPEPGAGGRNLLKWEELDSWITPNPKFFRIAHYQGPLGPVVDEQGWRLEISGLVDRPLSFTLGELKARPRQEVTFTVECSGNHGFPWFIGGVGTATWAGTPLAPILQEAGVQERGTEVVFFGRDAGEQDVREVKLPEPFARGMAVTDAMDPRAMLCYEMNGEPLPQPNGFPVRLIAPGWYGVANVKWLDRIEVLGTRYAGRFMARDYVTIREEQRNGTTIMTETWVGRTLLKSVPAKVAQLDGQYRIVGAAWGAPIARVEVQVDGGPWMAATIDEGDQAEFAWKIWSLAWGTPTPGEHTITSRATDAQGNIQPAMDDPRIANKRTYWESNGQVTRRIQIT